MISTWTTSRNYNQTMSKITTTYIYKVNGDLVVADNIEDAIKIYKEHLLLFGELHPVIKSVTIVEDNNIVSSNVALIRDK